MQVMKISGGLPLPTRLDFSGEMTRTTRPLTAPTVDQSDLWEGLTPAQLALTINRKSAPGEAKLHSITLTHLTGNYDRAKGLSQDAACTVAVSTIAPGPLGGVISTATTTYLRREASAEELKNADRSVDRIGATRFPCRIFTVTREGDQLQESASPHSSTNPGQLNFLGDSITLDHYTSRFQLDPASKFPARISLYAGRKRADMEPLEDSKFHFAGEIARGLLSVDASAEDALRIMDQVGQALAYDPARKSQS